MQTFPMDMTHMPTLDAPASGMWTLQGAIGAENAATLRLDGEKILRSLDGEQVRICVDCSRCIARDSSVVSLLLCWLRSAQKQGGTLRCTGLPPALVDLLTLYGILELFTAPSQHQVETP